jgi:hypothetical protein
MYAYMGKYARLLPPPRQGGITCTVCQVKNIKRREKRGKCERKNVAEKNTKETEVLKSKI